MTRKTSSESVLKSSVSAENEQATAQEQIARLNDAAPALLSALKQIAIEAEREQGNWQHLKRVIRINARAAIARAEHGAE